jgi:hypothetical protein
MVMEIGKVLEEGDDEWSLVIEISNKKFSWCVDENDL